jgi:hypothetical protein
MRLLYRLTAHAAMASLGTALLVGCGGAPTATERGESLATSEPSAEMSSQPEAEPLDLAGLVEGVPGYTYPASPEAEQAFVTQLGDDLPANYIVRGIAVNGELLGNVIITDNGSEATEREISDSLAGAVAGGKKVGTASRKDIAGVPAVEVVRADGGKTWSVSYSRYIIIVGARPEVADAFTTELLERLIG